MRMFIIGAVASLAVSGAVLFAALAQDFNARPRDRCTATFSIDPRDVNETATDLRTQRAEDLI